MSIENKQLKLMISDNDNTLYVNIMASDLKKNAKLGPTTRLSTMLQTPQS